MANPQDGANEPPKPSGLPILQPQVQVAFYARLQEIRSLHLTEALRQTVAELNIPTIDDELARYVGAEKLAVVAQHGLRGEVLFPVPYVLKYNPHLLGYYRLLYGFSQKEFYAAGSPGYSFKRLEVDGLIPNEVTGQVGDLCSSLVQTAWMLIQGLDRLSTEIVHDLQLLTLGPQLRGSRNTELGKAATRVVFNHIRSLIMPRYIQFESDTLITLLNDSRRSVSIEFSADPDIAVREQVGATLRNEIAIQIKGGTDRSNVHNRLGEAEKSHQKAKGAGFTELWTIVAVDIDEPEALRETPTTTKLFHLSALIDPTDQEHREFEESLCSILGISLPREGGSGATGPVE